jgi:hypothetical protein
MRSAAVAAAAAIIASIIKPATATVACITAVGATA